MICIIIITTNIILIIIISIANIRPEVNNLCKKQLNQAQVWASKGDPSHVYLS
jgi:hypothetical protein